MRQAKKTIYTDLAIETTEILNEKKEDKSEEIAGVAIKGTRDEQNDITITWVTIENEKGAEEMGKPIGNYITIEAPGIKGHSAKNDERIIEYVSENLIKLISPMIKADDNILVVGLGNWNVTPDALGPKVVSQTLVTRHIIEEVPIEIDESVRPVSALSPRVMGITGIETSEIIRGVVDRVKPKLVIAVDALAARRTSRINSTIQMTDTGVAPGGGMGNKRKMLSEETLGVPVVAIGVPTVVDAATLINDTMDKMLAEMVNTAEKGTSFYEMLSDLDSNEKYSLIVELLDPYTENMFVTPKEVDAVIEKLANIISNGINIALHPGIEKEDINRY